MPQKNMAEMPFLEHIKELRDRLMVCALVIGVMAVVAYIFSDLIIEVLTMPYREVDTLTGNQTLYINSLIEGFTSKLKVAGLTGLTIGFPVVIYHAVRFIFPALLPHERKIVILTLFSSFILVIASAYMTYFYIIPFSVKYLLSQGFIPDNVGILLNYSKNMFYVFQFLLLALVVFQLPLILELMMIMGFVKRKQVLGASRYIVVAIFVLAAIVTPPDVISQLSIALPLVILFYLTLLIAKIFNFGAE